LRKPAAFNPSAFCSNNLPIVGSVPTLFVKFIPLSGCHTITCFTVYSRLSIRDWRRWTCKGFVTLKMPKYRLALLARMGIIAGEIISAPDRPR
jgi:hypothetical protein